MQVLAVYRQVQTGSVRRLLVFVRVAQCSQSLLTSPSSSLRAVRLVGRGSDSSQREPQRNSLDHRVSARSHSWHVSSVPTRSACLLFTSAALSFASGLPFINCGSLRFTSHAR